MLNVVTIVRGVNVASTGPVAPGTTRGTLALQMDVHRFALPIIRVTAPNCATTYIDDTNVAVPPAKPGGAWAGDWTVDACGSSFQIRLDFTSQGSGTNVAAHKRP